MGFPWSVATCHMSVTWYLKLDFWICPDLEIRILSLRCFNIFFQLFGVKMGHECVDHWFQPAIHDALQLVHCESNAVVGKAILGEVVRADFFAPVPGSHLRSPRLCNLLALPLLFDLIKPRPQYPHGLRPVFDL